MSYFTKEQIKGVLLQFIKVRHSKGWTDHLACPPHGLVALKVGQETFLSGVIK